jgi:hypothetical protein
MIESETAAIITGLLAAMAIGAIIFIAQLVTWWLERRRRKANPYDQVGPIIHPADDCDGWDDWPKLEKWMKNHPEKAENYLRDAMEHRERMKK